ncbi:RagB/SusD family nutrient uptake outer membrane protein [Mariniflexile litorale]|uniref:RagB/SusD family nutrient uptake outer membrane protein n=1 Tax=Mariniflexile litorale TaxID=3045158 RepID=A0AAU7EKX2_9FLAO|nr:RagB/SusD family nutrient uptake outer membrane protein [Mariniflexile sp. KMM 9835]MDQ8210629.1 RagB/SusD family nutrient uptake outer membrane protein [Mariniflexile sp. KMM 9835]
MKNLKYIIISFLVVSTFSCQDFLDEVPKDSISPVNFYKTAQDAESAVNGAYAALRVNDYYSRYWITSSALASDGCFTRLGATSDRAEIIQLNDAGMLKSSRYNIAIWSAVWQAINRANAVIDHVPNIEMDPTLRARIVGEAKFLRALTYFNMVRRWGGVPLILNETSTSDISELQVSRDTPEAVYAQIVTDLTDAMAVLPNISSYTGNDVGRASKEAAQGLLAKVQLYTKDFPNAKINALAVINPANGLDLMLDPKDNWWMGNGDVDNNVESVFEVQYNGVSPQGHELGNNFEPNNNGYGPGQWGTIIGSLWWFNQFSDNDKRKPATWLTEFPKLNGGGELVQWQENTYPVPHVNKYRDPDNKIGNSMPYNIKVLRFADVLLTAAEAINESEGPTNAYPYVNRVRFRAGLPDLSGLTKEELREAIYLEFRKELCFEGQDYEELVRQGKLLTNKTAYATYTVPTMYDDNGNVFVPGQALLDRIKLYQPNLTFYELDAHNTIFPIPQTAIDKNPNLKPQNQGYPQ